MEKWFISIIEFDGYLYWITEIGCHFMRMNIKNKCIEYLRPLIDESLDGKKGAAVLCNWGRTIIYVIERGESIVLYDLDSNKAKSIKLSCMDMNLNAYSYAGVIDGKLIIIPTYCGEILEVELINERFRRVSLCESRDNDELLHFFSLNSVQRDGLIEIILSTSNEMIEIDLNSLRIISRKKVGVSSAPIINYEYRNDDIILLDRNNTVYQYKDGVSNKITNLGEMKDGYLPIVSFGNNTYFFPGYEEALICINEKNEKRIVKAGEGLVYNAPKSMAKYYGKVNTNGVVFFAMHAGDSLISVDNEGVKILDVSWPTEEENVRELVYQRRRSMTEVGVTIEEFLRYVCQNRK